jgi:predicted permease
MRLVKIIGGGLRALFGKQRAEDELDEELRCYVENAVEHKMRAGMGREEATSEARMELGGMEALKEEVRDVGWETSVESFLQDVRYGLRMLRKNPSFTSVAVLALALGIGANTAVFSVMNALLLKSAPVSDPRTLVALYTASAANPGWHQTSFKNYQDLRDAVPFGVAAFAAIPVGLSTAGNQPDQVPTEIVSGNYFELLGVQAALGRAFAFTAEEDKVANKHPDVVISDALWKRRFGSRTDVVNQTVQLNARPFTIVGVAPAGFVGLDLMRAVDVWVPSLNQEVLTGVHGFYFRNRSIGMFDVVARTTPTGGLPQVQSMLQAEAFRLAQMFPQDNKGLSFATRPFWQARMNPAQREKWVRAGGLLVVVVGLVLLIACANVANLLLARSASRRREVAVRLAIGATRRRLVRQLLVESLMLSSAGALAGLSVAWGALQLLSALRPAFVPASFHVQIDWTALLFTGAVAFVIGPLFGLLPALQASGADVVDGLKSGEVALQRVGRSDFSLALLVAQSTLATVALILAGLFVSSLQHAQEIHPGFNPDRVVIVSFDLGMLRYDNTKGPAFVRRVNERMRAIPGVISSAVASHVLLDGAGLASKIKLAGYEDAEAISVEAGAVGLDYFRTMGISVVAGRSFQESDADVSEFGWAIVNQTMAEYLWPQRDAIGQRFQVLGIQEPYIVVGVVTDAQYDTLGELRRPYLYIYYDQTPGLKKLTLHVKTASDPQLMLGTIQREIQAADPNLPLVKARTMSDVLKQAMWVPRTGAALLMLFGTMALILAVVGTYSVTAFLVTQRQREIGIRVALGATPANILFPVVRRTFMPTLVGMGLGLAVSYFGARLVGSLLIGVTPTDAKSFGSAVVVLAVAAGAASLLPALSAMRLDPARVLRRD